ncbi:MAG: MBL fold metallo-hydrolase [Clostridiales bacterium]|nr:MBL fold metallo-hydrolase [Clostridiales bacterium]
MESTEQLSLNPIEIADGIFWLGYENNNVGLHCNPYLIREGNEAVLIDGGSRDDFSYVMLKILRTGIKPAQIKRLIYHHYDPDLCGSLPQMEAIINTDELRIISHMENNVFIHYYSKKTPKTDFHTINSEYVFPSGRTLQFYATPFCHSPGSFMTYDTKTKTLFSSDLFGSYDANWNLYLELNDACDLCTAQRICPHTEKKCPLYGIDQFHRRIMTSTAALCHALDVIESLEIERVAPQHGSILKNGADVRTVIDYLRRMGPVGIDYLEAEKQL